jgi:predicted RNA-binding protein with RPS1 domain
VIALGDEVEGYLRASEVSRDRVEDLTHAPEGRRHVDAMIINVDRKNRTINLSIKAKDQAEQNRGHAEAGSREPGPAGTTNLGALLKAKLDNKNASSNLISMTKSELIARLAERFSAARRQGCRVRRQDDPRCDDEEPGRTGSASRSADLAAFALNYRPPRTGRNPKSGEKVQVPAEVRAAFQGRQGIARAGRSAQACGIAGRPAGAAGPDVTGIPRDAGAFHLGVLMGRGLSSANGLATAGSPSLASGRVTSSRLGTSPG